MRMETMERGRKVPGHPSRAFSLLVRLLLPGILIGSLGGSLSGCAGMAGHGEEETGSAPAEIRKSSPGHAEVPLPADRFAEPGDLDRLLDAKPIALAAVRPSSQSPSGSSAAVKASEPAIKGKGGFRIQVGAESDVDAAQAKKAEYEKLLGGQVDVIFDAPYYKLRWGYFDSRQDAEDKLLELSDFKIQGFVIKQ